MGFDFSPVVWFVCKICKEAFSDIDTLKEHKLENHLGDCIRVKCVIFEETLLDHEWSPGSSYHPDASIIRRKSLRTGTGTNRKRFQNPFVSLKKLTAQELISSSASSSRINVVEIKKSIKAKKRSIISSSLATHDLYPPSRTTKRLGPQVDSVLNETNLLFGSIFSHNSDANIPIKVEFSSPNDDNLSLKSDSYDDLTTEPFSTVSDGDEEESVCEARNFPKPQLKPEQEQEPQLDHEIDQGQGQLTPKFSPPIRNKRNVKVPTKFNQTFQKKNRKQYLRRSQAKSKTRAIRHLKNKEKTKTYLCEIDDCFGSFKYEKWLHNHYLKYHPESHQAQSPKTYKCPLCEVFFSSKASVTRHLMVHSVDRPWKCTESQCSATFKRDRDLKSHMITHGKGIPSQFKCKSCDRWFRSRSLLVEHERSHTGVRPFKCTVGNCQSAFFHKQGLNNHKRTSHGAELGLPSLLCPSCGKTFGYQSRLNRHAQRYHGAERPNKCTYDGCSQSFMFKYLLEEHVRLRHTGERPFQCDKCGRGYALIGQFHAHLRKVHEGTWYAVKCSLCDRKFQAPSLLKNHMKDHESGPSYPCGYCSFVFTTTACLNRHVAQVHTRKDNDGQRIRKKRIRKKVPKNVSHVSTINTNWGTSVELPNCQQIAQSADVGVEINRLFTF